MITFAGRDHLDPPALEGRIALIHAEEVADENRRFIAAGAGPDFEDDIALIGGILGHQKELELLLEFRDAPVELGLLGLRHLDHVLVARRDHLVETGEVRSHLGEGARRIHHRPQLGIFLRQPDKALTTAALSEFRLDDGETLLDAVELGLRNTHIRGQISGIRCQDNDPGFLIPDL